MNGHLNQFSVNKRISCKHFVESMKFIKMAFILLLVLMTSAQCQQTAENWVNKGEDFYNKSMFDEAIKAFDEAIKVDPYNSDAWTWKGYAFENLGKHEEAISAYEGAIKAYDKAIKKDPKDSSAWQNKGWLYYHQKKYTDAIKAFDNTFLLFNDTESNITRAASWFGKGQSFYALGNYDDAIAAYEKAVRLYPKHARAWYGIGQAFYEQKKYVEAIEAFNETVKLDPLDDEAWHNMSLALREINEYDLADQAAKQETSAIFGGFYETQENEAHERKKSLKEATNGTGVTISPDQHGYSNFLAPIDPYELAFSIRTVYDYLSLNNYTFLREVGSSKTYHIENFTTHEFAMFDGGDKSEIHTITDHALVIKITQYTGPAKYIPENPAPLGYDEVPHSWHASSPREITIDGHSGSWIIADASTTKATGRPDVHILTYSMNPSTFVTIESNMDWDKDVALVIETIHITEKKV